MNLYKLTQMTNNGWDTYDSLIVAARSENNARLILPTQYERWGESYSTWADTPEQVTVQKIGTTKTEAEGVILASFNAG